MRKKTSKKLIVAILLVTMLSQTLYSAAAGIFGVRTQSTAYADDEYPEDVEAGEPVDESTQQDAAEASGEEYGEASEEEDGAAAEESEEDAEEAEDEEQEEVPEVSLRISYVDGNDNALKDTEDFDIDPDFMYIFRYEAPQIEDYTYNKTTIDIEDTDTDITAISAKDKDGIPVYSITTDEDTDDKDYEDIEWTELAEDSVIVMHYDAVEKEEAAEDEVSDNKAEDKEDKEDKEEAEPSKRVYEYEDSRIYAKATLERADAVPDDAIFVVKDVTGSTDADDAVDRADRATDTDLDKEKARVYDIHFENEELGEIEPEEGSVKIEIRFKKSIIQPADDTEDRSISVVHVDDAGKASEVSADVSDSASGISNVEFETDSLSYYVVAPEVSSATTAAEALAGGSSLVPMVSKVSINGQDIPNNAADYQLPESNNGVYTLGVSFKENGTDQFGPVMYYQLPSGMKPENTSPAESSLSLAGSFGEDGEPLSGTIPFAYHIETDESGNCYLIVEFDKTSKNYRYLDAASSASFSVGVKVTIADDATEIRFAGSDMFAGTILIEEKEEEVVDNSKLAVAKTSAVSADGKKIHYVIKVKSTGENRQVFVRDWYRGYSNKYLELDESSVRISSNKQSGLSASTSGNPDGEVLYMDGFDMSDGEIITIEYDCNVKDIPADTTKTIAVGNYVGIYKTTQWNWQAEDQTEDTLFTYEPDVEKSIVRMTDDQSEIEYKIVINKNKKMYINGMEIKDYLSHTIVNYANFTGEGIYVNGKLVKWGQDGLSTLAEANTLSGSQKRFKYTLGDLGYTTVEITYKVAVDTDSILANNNLKNKVYVDGGSAEVTTPFKPVDENKLKVTKTAGEITEAGTVPWTVTFTVPKAGYSSCEVTDMLPTYWTRTVSYVDPLAGDKSNIRISSSDGRPLYYEIYSEKSEERADGEDEITIVFYKDQRKTQKGIGEGSEAAVITVSLETRLNEEWLELATREGIYSDSSTHTNNVYVGANGIEKSAKAEVTKVFTNSLNKKAAGSETVEIDGVSYPAYKYHVEFTGVNDATLDDGKLVFTDVFPEYFTLYDQTGDTQRSGWGKNQLTSNKHIWLMYNDNGWFNWNERVQGEAVISEEGDNCKATITIDVPKKGNDYYDTYAVEYWLIPDGAEGLQALREQSAYNGGYEFENTAGWSGKTSSATSRYDYVTDSVSKECTEEPSLENDYVGTFKVTVNRGGITYGNQDYLDVYDYMTNLKPVKEEPIQITYSDGDSETVRGWTWDTDKGAWKFTIKNGVTAEIVYKAKVIGSIGQKVDYSNYVTFFGYESSKTHGETEVEKASGTVALKTVKLDKKASDTGSAIAGATFRLYRWDGSRTDTLDLNDSHWTAVTDKWGRNVDRTTNGNGRASFFGDYENEGWTLEIDEYYAVKEISAPAGYKVDPDYHAFIVQADHAVTQQSIPVTVIPIDANDAGITITDEKLPTTEFSILKVEMDAAGNLTESPLEGARFSLTPVNDMAKLTGTKTAVTGADGKATFDGIYGSGEYRLEETEAPEGYELGDVHEWNISVDDDLKVTADNGLVFTAGSRTGEDADGSSEYVAKVGNKGIPKTGSLTVNKTLTGAVADSAKTALLDAISFRVEKIQTDENGIVTDEFGEVVTDSAFTPVVLTHQGGGRFGVAADLPVGTYRITETGGSAEGKAVAVTFDGGNTAFAVNDEEQSATFSISSQDPDVVLNVNNEYRNESVDVSVPITKEFLGGAGHWKDGFKFTLQEVSEHGWGNIGDPMEMTLNGGDKDEASDKYELTYKLSDIGWWGDNTDYDNSESQYAGYRYVHTKWYRISEDTSENRDDVTYNILDELPSDVAPDSPYWYVHLYIYADSKTNPQNVKAVIRTARKEPNGYDYARYGLPCEEDGVIVFRNEYKPKNGTIRLTKKVLRNEVEVETGDFYNVRLFGNNSYKGVESGAKDFQNIKFTSSKGRRVDYTEKEEPINNQKRRVFYFSLQGGETITVEGLPLIDDGVDSTYWIQELFADGVAKPEIAIEAADDFTKSNRDDFVTAPFNTSNFEASATMVNKYYSDTEYRPWAVKAVKFVPSGTTVKHSFSLYEGDRLIQGPKEVSIQGGKTVKFYFDPIKYDHTMTGDHTYTVKETPVDGVVSSGDISFTVRVATDAQGNLTAKALDEEAGSGDGVRTITNTYPIDGTPSVILKKELTGRAIKRGDDFAVEVRKDGELLNAGDVHEGRVYFPYGSAASTPAIRLDTYDGDAADGRAHEYTFKEVNNGVAGVSYDDTEYKVTITPSVEDGNVVFSYSSTEPMVFVNTYDANGSVSINTVKHLDGNKALTGGMFSFRLKDAGGNVLQTKTNGADGSVKFDAIGYKLSDLEGETSRVFSYTVDEVIPEGVTAENGYKDESTGITYDPASYDITVTVTDNGDGTLGVVKGGETEALESTGFSNRYDEKGTIKLRAKKTINKWPAGKKFYVDLYEGSNKLTTFELSEAKPVSDFYTIEVGADKKDQTSEYRLVEQTATDGTEGIKYDSDASKNVSVTWVSDGKGRLVPNHSGSAVEVEPGQLEVTYNNTYNATGEFTPKVEKTMQGAKLIEDFTFDLYAADKTTVLDTKVVKKSNGYSGTASFNTQYYGLNDAGTTYTYYVKERKGTNPGITYDEAWHEIKVELTDDNMGSLTKKVTIDGSVSTTDTVSVVNTYHSKGEIQIQAKKQVKNGSSILPNDRLSLNGRFEFELTDKAGNSVDKAKTDASGIVTFKKISVSEAGIYEYSIAEISEDTDEYKKQGGAQPVTVTVRDQGNGALTAEYDYGQNFPVFVNEYTDDAEVELGGTKTLEGRANASKTFTFDLIARTEGDTRGDTKSVTYAAGENGRKSFTFDTLTYTVADLGGEAEKSFCYEVSEQAATGDGVTYATNRYAVKVTLKLVDGDLKADKEVVEVDSEEPGFWTNLRNTLLNGGNAPIEFTNSYEATGSVPLAGRKTLAKDDGTLSKAGFTFSVKDERGREVATGVSKADGTIEYTVDSRYGSGNELTYSTADAGVHTYTVSETSKDGFLGVEDKTLVVKVEDKGTGSLEVTADGAMQLLSFENTPTELNISKRDITTGAELAGANMTLTGEGKTFTWTSDGSNKTIYGLKAGTYKLTETAAPAGYELAREATVRLAEDGSVTVSGSEDVVKAANGNVTNLVIVNDRVKPVTITKVSAADKNVILKGAKFAVTDADGKALPAGSVEDKMATDGIITLYGLETGRTYKIKETEAPKGYALADEVKFRIGEDRSIEIVSGGSYADVEAGRLNITVKDDPIVFYLVKYDPNGNKLAGAKWEIQDAEGGVVPGMEELTSLGEGARLKVSHLEPGTYRLVETDAPEGYEKAPDVEFTISDRGVVTSGGDVRQDTDGAYLVTMTDKKIGELVFAGEKIWKDGNDENATRPDSIRVVLQRKLAKSALSGEGEPWTDYLETTAVKPRYRFTFDDELAAASGKRIFETNEFGVKYEYQIKEVLPDTGSTLAGKNGAVYIAENSGLAVKSDSSNDYVITNRIRPEKVNVNVQKTWHTGGVTKDDIYTGFTATLQKKVDGEYVNVTDKDGKVMSKPVPKEGVISFTDLDKYDGEGYEIVYRVEETNGSNT